MQLTYFLFSLKPPLYLKHNQLFYKNIKQLNETILSILSASDSTLFNWISDYSNVFAKRVMKIVGRELYISS